MSCEGQALAPSFLAGDLDEVSAAAFEAHLLICDECWAALEEDRVGRAAAEQLRELAPPGSATASRWRSRCRRAATTLGSVPGAVWQGSWSSS